MKRKLLILALLCVGACTDEMDEAKANYIQCLKLSAAHPEKCESERVIYETERQYYDTVFNEGLSEGDRMSNETNINIAK